MLSADQLIENLISEGTGGLGRARGGRHAFIVLGNVLHLLPRALLWEPEGIGNLTMLRL